MANTKTENGRGTEDHKFAFIIFSDPAYQPGWTERRDIPKARDTIHIGIGIIVEESDESITISLFEELYDKRSDVFHPLTLLKSHIIKLYTFTENLMYEQSKRNRPIYKHIDKDVEDFCKEE